MESYFQQKLIHNISSPIIMPKNIDMTDKNVKNNLNDKNIMMSLKRKLSPLKLSNKLMSKKKFQSNKLFKLRKTRNKNSILLSNDSVFDISGETIEKSADKIMNKYFYPDFDEKHEYSKKLNKSIDINKILTFYSKKKYRNDIEELRKMINKQKKISILTHDYSRKNNYNDLSSLYSAISKKSSNTKGKKIIQLDSNTSNVTNKNGSQNSISNYITIDIHKKLYKSPLHSFNIVKKNNLIYNSVIDEYNNKCINRFKKLENNLGPLINLKSNSSKKVKILPFISKIPDKVPNFQIKVDESLPRKVSLKLNEEINILNQAIPLYFSKFLNIKKKQEKYLLTIKNFYPGNNSPESRSQFILIKEGNDIILHGGYNICRKHNIWLFNPNEKSWESIEPTGVKNELRYAHSGALYKRNLYIFGGKYFKGINLADIEIFNLDKKCWIFPRLESEKRIPLRRNHVSCGVGNCMFIHGGMDEENRYLNDMYLLNYKPLKWLDVEINNREIKIPPLAHHCCCLVVPDVIVQNPYFNIYSTPELGEKSKKGSVKEKGIYIFGGKISDDGPIINNIYVIKIGIKPLQIVQLKTSGIPPCPRYDSSLNYYEKGNMLIIHGGRNNNVHGENGLNDTFILELFHLSWTYVEYYNEKNIVHPRYFHQCFEYEGELYIFGGMEGNKFVGSELEIIDLNSNSKCVRERFIFDNLKKKVEVEKNENSLQTKNNSSNQTKSNENLFFNKLNKNNLFKYFMK